MFFELNLRFIAQENIDVCTFWHACAPAWAQDLIQGGPLSVWNSTAFVLPTSTNFQPVLLRSIFLMTEWTKIEIEVQMCNHKALWTPDTFEGNLHARVEFIWLLSRPVGMPSILVEIYLAVWHEEIMIRSWSVDNRGPTLKLVWNGLPFFNIGCRSRFGEGWRSSGPSVVFWLLFVKITSPEACLACGGKALELHFRWKQTWHILSNIQRIPKIDPVLIFVYKLQCIFPWQWAKKAKCVSSYSVFCRGKICSNSFMKSTWSIYEWISAYFSMKYSSNGRKNQVCFGRY